MKFTLFVVSILLQGIYGESLSDILAQPSSQLRNLNKLRSQLPGYYPGYIQKRQDEKEPTAPTPRQDEPGMPSDPDCSSAPPKHRNALSFLFDDVKPSVLPSNRLQGVSDQIGEFLYLFMQVMSCVRDAMGAKAFGKVFKHFRKVLINTFENVSDLFIQVMKCAEKPEKPSSWFQDDAEKDVLDKVYDCFKIVVGKGKPKGFF